MNDRKVSELKKTALEIRKDIIRMAGVSRSYGLASASTVVEMLVFLYWSYMRVPASFDDESRDRFVLSKASATPALYACLARLGFFSRDELWNYRRLGATLQGYPDIRTPGIEAPGGIYGGGPGIACGISLGLRMSGNDARVFCILGDGELNEGVVWESVCNAARNRLGNLFLLFDLNSKPEDTPVFDMKNAVSLKSKLEAFGWQVRSADGHDFLSIESGFADFDFRDTSPKALLAHTCTGRGLAALPQAEGSESAPISKDEMDQALSFLEREGEAE